MALAESKPGGGKKVKSRTRRSLQRRTPALEDLPSTVYTSQVIREHASVSPGLEIRVWRDDTIGGYKV